jgi:pimeloyl-ACP methyl ester carboxylesterase
MPSQSRGLRWSIAASLLSSLLFAAGVSGAAPSWREQHDQLVIRLRALKDKEGDFGAAYQPLYHAMIGWYEAWGGRNDSPVDANMVSPEEYASGLADALEHGRNFIAENRGCLFPLMFEKALPGGRVVRCNYWLILPRGFPSEGRRFPLQVGLHGSGWLAHKISFARGKNDDSPMFSVTPIDEAGPWQVDFLNAYLDELESILPVDQDRVYLEGHSLGAMATWEWSLDNPERFAAISPRDGVGEPYRAIRLRNVPAWVIHGGKDDVIYPGYAEEMISAIRATGGTARYSLLPEAPHNVPADFDQASVVTWYLEHTRSHRPPPPDPRDALGLNDAGFSQWVVLTAPAGEYWRSAPVEEPDGVWEVRKDELPLFRKIQDRGLLVDEPIRQVFGPGRSRATLWLEVPPALAPQAASDSSVVHVDARKAARFYFRGTYRDGLAHADLIAPKVAASGRTFSGTVWVTPLSLWQNSPRGIAEYSVELN